jgi:hypothetical protein
MMSNNAQTTPHNPDYIDENRPQPRKGRAGRFHKLQQAGLARQEPLTIQERSRPPLGRVIAEFGMLVGWFALWVLNGAATAFGVAAFGVILKSRGLAVSLDRVDWLVIGAVFHLFISAVENHLWRADYALPDTIPERVQMFFSKADRMRLGMAVFIGALDSLSTAWYLRRFIVAFYPATIGAIIVSSILASLIALSGETMIRNFAGKLITLFKED